MTGQELGDRRYTQFVRLEVSGLMYHTTPFEQRYRRLFGDMPEPMDRSLAPAPVALCRMLFVLENTEP